MTVAINTGASVDTTTTPAPEGHDAAMIAKVDAQASTAPADGGQTSTTTPAADRPAWLPEKFATAEDFAKSYAALEAKLGGGDKAPTADTTKPATTEIPTADAARDQVTQAGLDFDAINAEFAKDGKLSDATYDRLAKAGIARTTADGYIAGQQALANQVRNEVFASAGGEEAYSEIVQWASTNMSDAEINAYNKAMNGGDTNVMKLAVDGLKARFTAANGTTPKLLNGGSGNGSQAQGDVFRSNAELTTAMKDPRYATDPAYRDDVKAKLGRSNIM
jgi:hypothetical protein